MYVWRCHRKKTHHHLRATHMNLPFRTHEWVMSHIEHMYMSKSCGIYIDITYTRWLCLMTHSYMYAVRDMTYLLTYLLWCMCHMTYSYTYALCATWLIHVCEMADVMCMYVMSVYVMCMYVMCMYVMSVYGTSAYVCEYVMSHIQHIYVCKTCRKCVTHVQVSHVAHSAYVCE